MQSYYFLVIYTNIIVSKMRKILIFSALGIEMGILGTKCGICEPLQSPTGLALEMDGSAELCRERPNNNSRPKYYDSSRYKNPDASCALDV